MRHGDLLFEGLPWGSEMVLCESVRRLVHQEILPALLPYWYDVDRPDDLAWLRLELSLLSPSERPPLTTQILEKIGAEGE